MWTSDAGGTDGEPILNYATKGETGTTEQMNFTRKVPRAVRLDWHSGGNTDDNHLKFVDWIGFQQSFNLSLLENSGDKHLKPGLRNNQDAQILNLRHSWEIRVKIPRETPDTHSAVNPIHLDSTLVIKIVDLDLGQPGVLDKFNIQVDYKLNLRQ